MKRCSTPFTTREMRIKPTVRYHFILTRMVIMEKTVTSVGGGVEKLESSKTAGGNVKLCSHLGRQFGSSSKG